ncbi:MAG: A24 family peptidase [Myxococcales bacterium]
MGTEAELSFALRAGTALVACGIAVAIDFKQRRIPNRLTATTALVGLALQLAIALAAGRTVWIPLGLALSGAALALAVFLPLSWLGAVGFGDTKLMVALGVCFGPVPMLQVIVATALAGGVMALAQSARHAQLNAVWTNLRRGQLLARRIDEPGHKLHQMPYALAIACGTGWTVLAHCVPQLALL